MYYAAAPQPGVASELQKFGVSEVHYLTQPHQLTVAQKVAVEGNCFAPIQLASGNPVRKSQYKSASPTVEDIICENVSVIANKPKPETPYMQSNGNLGERLYDGPEYQQIFGNRIHVASPVELLDTEILGGNSATSVQLIGKSVNVCGLG